MASLSKERKDAAKMALGVAKNAWSFVGNAERLAACQDRLESLGSSG